MTSIEKDNTRLGKFRDNLAWSIANFALNHIATPWYRAMICGSIELGLDEAAKRSEK